MNKNNFAPARAEKTYHRWTPEEDTKLIDFLTTHQESFKSIGQPGGFQREVFWAQVPGALGIMATAQACAMRYRTLTAQTDWAKQRREAAGLPQPDTGDLPASPEIAERVEKLLDEMTTTMIEMRGMMAIQTENTRKLLEVWTTPLPHRNGDRDVPPVSIARPVPILR